MMEFFDHRQLKGMWHSEGLVPDNAVLVTYPDGDQYLYVFYEEKRTTFYTFCQASCILSSGSNRDK